MSMAGVLAPYWPDEYGVQLEANRSRCRQAVKVVWVEQSSSIGGQGCNKALSNLTHQGGSGCVTLIQTGVSHQEGPIPGRQRTNENTGGGDAVAG